MAKGERDGSCFHSRGFDKIFSISGFSVLFSDGSTIA